MSEPRYRTRSERDLERALALVLDAAEEWAESLDLKADDLAAHGQIGRDAAAVTRSEAIAIREAIATYRPLRRRDPETDEWVEVEKPDLDDYDGFVR